MNKKIIIGLVVLLVLGAGAVFGLRAWRGSVVRHQEERAYKKAGQLLQADQAAEAYAIVAAMAKPDSTLDWPALEVAALAGIRDLPRLSAIYEKTPGRVLANEEASVLVARGFRQIVCACMGA